MVDVASRRGAHHSFKSREDSNAAYAECLCGFSRHGTEQVRRPARGGTLMRWVFAAWALPMGIFWGWFTLSYYDMNFGYVMLTRDVHDLLFQLYGQALGIDPATIPPLVAKACILDTLLILGIWAFRRRKEIAAWWRAKRQRYFGAEPSPSA
jgi:hypothetical protein